MRAADLLFSLLSEYDTKRIYGVPGDELAVFDALGKSNIKFVTTRHEQAAAFMAAAEAKINGTFGVCISTLGPGAANLVTGVADAYQSRSPIIVFSGQISSKKVSEKALYHQYINFKQLFEPITKATFSIDHPELVIKVLNNALYTATSGRPGPVHITLYEDVMEREVENVLTHEAYKRETNRSFSDIEIEQVAELIKSSNFPIAFLGGIANKNECNQEIRKFLERYNMPVITSFMGKGSFNEFNPLSLGTVSKYVKDPFSQILQKADLFLTIGYDYVEGITPEFFDDRRIVSLDTFSLNDEGVLKPSLELVGDVKHALIGLGKAMGDYNSSWKSNDITETRKKIIEYILNNQPKTEIPMNIYHIINELNSISNEAFDVVSDVGNHKQAVALTYTARNANSVHFSNGLSCMGFSLPFSAGLKINDPSRTVIVVSGDGGFLMNVQEMETIKRYNLNVKVILSIDNAFGMIKSNLIRKYGSAKNMDFQNPDFDLLSKSFGWKAFHVHKFSDFRKIMKNAISINSPVLITVPVGYKI